MSSFKPIDTNEMLVSILHEVATFARLMLDTCNLNNEDLPTDASPHVKRADRIRVATELYNNTIATAEQEYQQVESHYIMDAVEAAIQTITNVTLVTK